MENNRRRHERFDMDQSIELTYGGASGINAKGINISESGMLCIAEEDIAVGMLVDFSMKIPGESGSIKVACQGVVLKSSREGDDYRLIIDFTDSRCL